MRTARQHGIIQPFGPMRPYVAVRYRTKFNVEGVGEYEIEVTNIVNTKTF